MAEALSPAQCILLAVHYAAAANIKALRSLTAARSDVLRSDLVLRILLTYLPESTEPSEYTAFVDAVAQGHSIDPEHGDAVGVDHDPVTELSPSQAERRVRKLHLVDVEPPKYPAYAPHDLLTAFVCHRAYRIDEQTGLLNLVPQLIEPFLDGREYLRTWYISTVVPLLRREYEYYTSPEGVEDEGPAIMGLREFEALEGQDGVDYLLSRVGEQREPAAAITSSLGASRSVIARDVRGLVGPWMYGHTERKRRKLGHAGTGAEEEEEQNSVAEGVAQSGRRNSLSDADKTGHDWVHLYRWLVQHARSNFALVTQCVEEWDGPGDVDLGNAAPPGQQSSLSDDLRRARNLQYAQAAIASCYVVETDTSPSATRNAHSILARVAERLGFARPTDLESSINSLSKIEGDGNDLPSLSTAADLEPAGLLRPENPLTMPQSETYTLLQLIVYSAHRLSALGCPTSLANVAKLHFSGDADKQLVVLQEILRGQTKRGARKDETQWAADRVTLLWLRNWRVDPESVDAREGAGVLGRIDREKFEEEILRAFIETASYYLAINLYLKEDATAKPLPRERVEQVVLEKAMEAYDGASNGNRTRGGMKKASDIITAFRPYFPSSLHFRQATALLAATHAMSFYSLTLQHGVPFQPVSIRVSSDPIGLVTKVLEQNPRSYTKLDDLVEIGKNLVSAGVATGGDGTSGEEEGVEKTLERRRTEAGRRVTFMAVDAALKEDDFETAYSYIVNRLTPSTADITARDPDKTDTAKKHKRIDSRGSARSAATTSDDDISWRAAFLAGRYRPATSSPPSLRRLEQRTELLSLALLLAPTSALTEILASWRRCEEETSALLRAQQQAEEEFDDRADKRLPTRSSLPGNFTVAGEQQPELVLNQTRREMGRMAPVSGKARGAEEEAPMSMFDLTRSAAQALSRGAFPLRHAATASREGAHGSGDGGMEASIDSLGSEGSGGHESQRVRKRDVVANAVSGGLASGIGWVLGATPVDRQQRDAHQEPQYG